MITKKYINYIVNKEEDFIEEEINKIKAYLTIIIGIDGDDKNEFPPITKDLIVINLNSQTGFEMDEQRTNEAKQLINNLNKS